MKRQKAKVFKKKALERIKGIHALSRLYNKKVGKPHQERLLELMRSHVDEIEDLLATKNKHALVETGDLTVLCLELLLEHRVSPADILAFCFQRYEKKLSDLIQEENQRCCGKNDKSCKAKALRPTDNQGN